MTYDQPDPERTPEHAAASEPIPEAIRQLTRASGFAADARAFVNSSEQRQRERAQTFATLAQAHATIALAETMREVLTRLELNDRHLVENLQTIAYQMGER